MQIHSNPAFEPECGTASPPGSKTPKHAKLTIGRFERALAKRFDGRHLSEVRDDEMELLVAAAYGDIHAIRYDGGRAYAEVVKDLNKTVPRARAEVPLPKAPVPPRIGTPRVCRTAQQRFASIISEKDAPARVPTKVVVKLPRAIEADESAVEAVSVLSGSDAFDTEHGVYSSYRHLRNLLGSARGSRFLFELSRVFGAASHRRFVDIFAHNVSVHECVKVLAFAFGDDIPTDWPNAAPKDDRSSRQLSLLVEALCVKPELKGHVDWELRGRLIHRAVPQSCEDTAELAVEAIDAEWVKRIINYFREEVKHIFKGLGDWLIKNPWFKYVIIAILAGKILSISAYRPYIITAILFACKLYNDDTLTVLSDSIRGIYKCKPKEEDKECGDDAEPQSTPAWILGAISTVLFNKAPLFMRIAQHERLMRGLELYIEGAKGAAETIVNIILSTFTKTRVEWAARMDKSVRVWFDDVVEFERETKMGAALDHNMHASYDALYGNGVNLRTMFHQSTPEYATVSRGLDKLAELAVVFPAFSSPGKARMEPIGIMLAGDPGCGKSTIVRRLSMTLAMYALKKRGEDVDKMDRSTLVYQKGSSKFWDSYANQVVCVMDDIFQNAQVPGAEESDASLAIKMINQWPFPLDMAALPLKGRFHFKSSFVIGTTNIETTAPLEKTVNSVGAFVRRFPFWFHMKRRQQLTPDYDADDAWVFYRYDIRNKIMHLGEPLTYSQVLDEIVDEFERKYDFEQQKCVADIVGINRDLEYLSSIDQRRSEIRTRLRRANPQCFGDIPSQPLQNSYRIISGAGSYLNRAASRVVDYTVGVPFRRACTRTYNNFIGLTTSVIEDTVPVVEQAITRLSTHTMGEVYLGVERTYQGACDYADSAFRYLLTYALNGACCFAGILLLFKFVDMCYVWFTGGRKAVPEAEIDDDVHKKIQRNIFEIRLKGGLHDKRMGYGLAIDENTLVAPEHFLVEAESKEATLYITVMGRDVALNKPLSRIPSLDQVWFNVVTQRKSILKHIGESKVDDLSCMISQDGIVKTRVLEQSVVHYNGRPRHVVAHSAHTKSGDCGKPIVLMDTLKRPCLLGIHVAGTITGVNHGFLSPLFLGAAQAETDFCGHKFIGKVPAIHNGRDTQFVPTSYSGVFGEVKTAPSVKRPVVVDGQLVDPMIKAIALSSAPHVDQVDNLDMVVSVVVGELFSDMSGVELRKLSRQEAVGGVPGEKYIPGIARSKACGYPLCIEYQNKQAFFGKTGDYVYDLPDTDRAWEQVDLLEGSYVNRKPAAVWRDSLKDEVRSLSKVSTAQTRIISGSALAYTILCRQYFATFVAGFMASRHKHGGMVGLNPYSDESSVMWGRLSSKNSKGLAFAGDYKNYDKTQSKSILNAIWSEICNRHPLYKTNKDIMDMLGVDMFEAVHLGGSCYQSDTLYQIDGSLPSGHPMTSVLNSIYNMVVFRLAWVDLYGICKVGDYRKHVVSFFYGDDNLAAPDDAHLDFNLLHMHKYCKKILMEYTTEIKDGDLYDLKPAVECGFIKRHFVEIGGRIYARLERDSLDDMFNWKKKSTCPLEHLRATSRACLMEAAVHSEDVFAFYYDKIESLNREYDLPSPSLGLGCALARDYWLAVYRGFTPVWSHDL